MLAQLGNALLIIGHPVTQARPEDLLEFGKSLISHRLGEADQRGGLHLGLLSNQGHRAEGNVVGVVDGKSGDLAQPLGQSLAAFDDLGLEGREIAGRCFGDRHEGHDNRRA